MPEPTPDARPAREQLAAEIERLIDQLDALDGTDDDLEPEEDRCEVEDAPRTRCLKGYPGEPEDEESTWTEPSAFAMQRTPMICGAESDDAEEDDAGEDNHDAELCSARNGGANADQTAWAYHSTGREDDEESPDAEPGSPIYFGYDEYRPAPADDAILARLRADRDRPRTVQVTGPDGIRLARFEPLPRRELPERDSSMRTRP
jgi:hypothetical protein